MAAQTWEEIVAAAQLSADEAKLLDNIVKRVPEFKDGRLRQSDYSRMSNELTAERKKVEAERDIIEKNKAWAEEKIPIWEGLVKAGAISEESEPLWPAEKEELTRQLEEAKKATVGGEMDPAELDKRVREIVKANGGVTPDELKALVSSEAKKLAEEIVDAKYKGYQTEFNEKTIPFVAGFSTAMAVNATKYEKETGEAFTKDKQKEVFDLMAKEQNFDPYEVVEKILAPVRLKKTNEAEIERLAQERANKIIAERGGLPGGGHEEYIPQPGESKGSLKMLLEKSAAEEGDLEAQVMAASRHAAQELRAAGRV
jgi:hypothetical protein